jgi:hypothetical protein
MRAREFLFEYNPAESQDLALISNAVADYLTKNPKLLISGNTIALDQIPMPKMSTPTGQALIDGVEVTMLGDAGIGKGTLGSAKSSFNTTNDIAYDIARTDPSRGPGKVSKGYQAAVSSGDKLQIKLNTQALSLSNPASLQGTMTHELKHQLDGIKGMDLHKLQRIITNNNWYKQRLASADQYEKMLLDMYKRNLEILPTDPSSGTKEHLEWIRQQWDQHQIEKKSDKKFYNPKLPTEYTHKVYMTDPTEVSARFEQAMANIAQKVTKTTTNEQIMPLIKEAFKLNHLYDIESPTGWEDAQKNPEFRKLLTNSYKLIQSEIANPVIGTTAQYSLTRKIYAGLIDVTRTIGSELYNVVQDLGRAVPKAISEPVAAAAGKAMTAAAPFVRAAAPVVRAATSLPVQLATATDDLGPKVPEEGPYSGSELDMTGRPWTPETLNSYNNGIKLYKSWQPWTPELKGMFQQEVNKLIAKGITGENLRKYLRL